MCSGSNYASPGNNLGFMENLVYHVHIASGSCVILVKLQRLDCRMLRLTQYSAWKGYLLQRRSFGCAGFGFLVGVSSMCFALADSDEHAPMKRWTPSHWNYDKCHMTERATRENRIHVVTALYGHNDRCVLCCFRFTVESGDSFAFGCSEWSLQRGRSTARSRRCRRALSRQGSSWL